MKWLSALVLVLVIMLFVGGPEAGDSRFIQALWNLGHVPLFAGLVLLGCAAPWARPCSVLRLFLAATLLALLAGIAIEWLQLLVGRNFDDMDVMRDVLGAWLGLSVYLASMRARSKRQRVALAGMVVLLALVALQPITLAMADSYAMRRAFPVLASFETSLELSRWKTQRATIALANEPVREGRQSLQVRYLADRFPDVSLGELQADWSAYQTVHASVFNTLATPLRITVKIFDREHVSRGYHGSDRFNREVTLQPGWNDLDIALADVKNAPVAREMDMAKIAGLSFFLRATDQPVEIYLDDIRLGKD